MPPSPHQSQLQNLVNLMDDALGNELSFKGGSIDQSQERLQADDSDCRSQRSNKSQKSARPRVLSSHSRRELPPESPGRKSELPKFRLKSNKSTFGDTRLKWSKRHTNEMGREILDAVESAPKQFRMGDIFFKI